MWFVILLLIALVVEYLYNLYKDINKLEINWKFYDCLINQIALWKTRGDSYLTYDIERIFVTSNCSTSLYVMLTFDTFSDEEMKKPPSIYKSTPIGDAIDKFLSTYNNVGSSQWISAPFAYGLNSRNISYAKKQINEYNKEHFPNLNIWF